jgi:hypothetical protein
MLTKPESALLSLPELRLGLFENEERRMQLLEWLLWFRIHGDQLCVNRVSDADFGAAPLFDDVPVTVTEGVAVPTDPRICFILALLIQDLKLTLYSLAAQSELNDQFKVQLDAAVKRFLYKLMSAFYTGRGAAFGEIDGLANLLASAKKLLPNDTTNFLLALVDLARVVDLVRQGEGFGPIVAVTSPIGLVNILKAHFDARINVEWIELEVWDQNGYQCARRVPAFKGIPIFVDDFVPVTERLGTFNDGTFLYVFRLGRGGLYGITGSPEGRPQVEVRESLDTAQAVTSARVSWSLGLVLESQCAAASLSFRPAAGTT